MKRRTVSMLLASLPLAAWRVSPSAAEDSCADIENLPRSESGLRAALGFELHTTGEQRCAGCAFFTADADDSGCGRCSLFSGGPVYTDSVCNSWAAE